MRPRRAMSAFMMLAILMASSMGCIGLVPAREFLEDLRDPPKLDVLTDKVGVNHTFITTSDIGSTEKNTTKTFEVNSEVIEIRAYIQADMALDFIFDVPDDVRYVNASLIDANGDEVWFESLTETARPLIATFQQPLAEGTWSLVIDSRGYGEDTAGFYQDSFQVVINIERQCWIYPTEDQCSYD